MNLADITQLLEEFGESDWADLCIRTEDCVLFVAKPGGGSNPLLQDHIAAHDDVTHDYPRRVHPSAALTDVVASSSEFTLAAPHVGDVAWLAAVGHEVAVGEAVARLEVLGESVEIRADAAARVVAILASTGVLAQFNTPLLRLARL